MQAINTELCLLVGEMNFIACKVSRQQRHCAHGWFQARAVTGSDSCGVAKPAIDAAAYLGAYSGSAWSVQLNNSRFVLTSAGESACNVFANDLDEPMTRNLLAGFLDYARQKPHPYIR